MNPFSWSRRLAAVASLGDESRRRLFRFVAAAEDAVRLALEEILV